MFCPQCNKKMLCPCESCKERIKDIGVYWKYTEDEMFILCGNCGFSPDDEKIEFSEFKGTANQFLRSGWNKIKREQEEQRTNWPEVVGDK